MKGKILLNNGIEHHLTDDELHILGMAILDFSESSSADDWAWCADDDDRKKYKEACESLVALFYHHLD